MLGFRRELQTKGELNSLIFCDWFSSLKILVLSNGFKNEQNVIQMGLDIFSKKLQKFSTITHSVQGLWASPHDHSL